MIKFVYFTDTHIRGTTPKNRLDAFPETLKDKINQVLTIAEKEEVDFLLHGGDVFDRPDLSPSTVGQFAQLFRKAPAPIYTISGNHDTFGHNPATVSRTMLGLLDAFGILTLIHPEAPVLIEKGDLRVQLSGQPYHYDLDQRDVKLDYYPANETNADVLIHMVHSMLVEKALPEGVAHTLVDHIWGTTADILFTGHFHSGFGIKEREGTFICNPGALARINNHWTEMERMPKVVIGKVSESGIELEEVELQAKKGSEVLDRTYVERASHQEEKLHEFVQQVKERAQFQTLQMNDIIREIAAMSNVEDKVRQEALRRMTLIEERWERDQAE
ncbi:DNA repair exonuclease SbcCD nuclease subunit [Alkalihalobacillus xiaoxiensis]|uniref:DNA repair exonuclease SbcCD nuclease subunit n=1 Tax=Shouchella xiaoxiensis TaxID=766895 RepID=A0ABS2STY1_9BACI|nr:exonuclease SbcCD subunit D [Shouchella xiaoxiensis]MBM7837717.1 DNA repair exonuclease SbcCD nuclease subunit [Shouchella xiaoxiensis]